MLSQYPVDGAGLGLRRAHLGPLLDRIPAQIGFMEIAPESWLGIGGRLGKAFARIAERIPIACHGVLTNLGGPDAIDRRHLRDLKAFLDDLQTPIFSDHLTFCGADGLLYELLPMPFTRAAAMHIAGRIRAVQDLLGRVIAVENASYYAQLDAEMSELDFITTVLHEADCLLLLDLNNIYVNSVNHGYDPVAFLNALPAERIAYAHIAGHRRLAPDLILDTHGAPVVDEVWDLLAAAYRRFGVFPTLLERDENVPELPECLAEVDRILALQAAHGGAPAVRAHG